MEDEPRKLYAIVRGDLPEGLRAAQMAHAVAGLVHRCGHSASKWETADNILIVLEVPDEVTLVEESLILFRHQISYFMWSEPDLDGAPTALACFPHPEKNWVLSELPLAFRRKGAWGRLKHLFGGR